ncbi:hypothetical protein [Hymenobacter terrenus]|uniref:hypothetical protein n=1 Tax=Hymenobacter terrenus TaxID=1629124 RepID=UPI000619A7CE|nr:hypothetical protein [Hymenobacter terrenus]
MATAGRQSLKFFLDNFDRQGSMEGERFVPWKQRKYQVNHKLLNKTGHLRAGFQLKSQGSKGFTITNDVPYAQYQNEGTKHLPKRPVLYASKGLEKQLTSQITTALKGLFR